MPKSTSLIALAAFSFLFFAHEVHAVDAPPPQLQTCLKKARDLPDMAAAEAESWLKKGGGDEALLCRATAEFHNSDYARSAKDFMTLAANQKDSHQAAILHQQAGLAFTRAQDFKNSEEQYNIAIKLENQDPELWVARANERAAAQRYWDAIEDLNQALRIMPDMAEALRTRGQVWFKLGLKHNAEDDFRHAAQILAEEDVAKSKTRPVAIRKNK